VNFSLRVLTVGLAAFSLAGLLVALIVPVLLARRSAASAVVRSRRLARIRLGPATVASATSLCVVAAFLAFESRRPDEHMPVSLQVAALCGAGLLLAAAVRSLRIALATRRLTREWFAGAEPIAIAGLNLPAVAVTSDFPVVAIIGIRRPTLVIARSVLAACSADELRAILAHEQGHLDRGDNLRRLLLMATPDVLAWLPISRRLYVAWCEAAEEAADDDAARTGQDGRAHLASALVKVARVATGRRASGLMPASAFYGGQNLESRVRRLLEPQAGEAAGHPASWPRVMATAGAIVAAALALPGLHALIEIAIHTLP
jgi:Zn-dependent protease with chaperone function